MAGPFESKDKIQHQVTDTDLNWSSPHHTIGKGPTQAAAGRHRHTYNEIDEPPVVPGEPDLTPYVRKDGDTMSDNLTVDKTTGYGIVTAKGSTGASYVLDAPPDKTVAVEWHTNGKAHWKLFRTNDAELGGNTGGTLTLGRYSDGGTYLSSILQVDRATAEVRLGIDPITAMGAVTKRYVDDGYTYDLAGANGFLDFGAAYAGVWLTAIGPIKIGEGMMKRTSNLAVTAGTPFQIANIGSAAWRPQHNVNWPGIICLDGGVQTECRIRVQAGGSIDCVPYTSGTLTTNGWISFNGVYRGI